MVIACIVCQPTYFRNSEDEDIYTGSQCEMLALSLRASSAKLMLRMILLAVALLKFLSADSNGFVDNQKSNRIKVYIAFCMLKRRYKAECHPNALRGKRDAYSIETVSG